MILHYKSKSGLGREGFWQKGKIKDKGEAWEAIA